MAKKSFVLYYDQKQVVDELSDEQAGKLFKAIYEYKIIFIPFKTAFDRDEIKWEETSKKRSEAGKKHTGNQYTRKKEMEQMEQNGTNGTVTVSVSDTVTVNDTVSESVSVNNIEPPHTPTEIFNFCLLTFPDYVENDLEKKCKKFFKHYEAKKWEGIYNWQSKLEEWIQDDIDKGEIRKKEIDTRKIREDEEGKYYQLNYDGTRYYI